MSENTNNSDVDLSEEWLAAIERCASEATPGPWKRIGGSGRATALVSTVDLDGDDLAQVFGPHDPPNANANFIAAARADVPALVAEVRRLRRRDVEREAWALRLLADAGDPVARALVNAPVVDESPDADEPQIDGAAPAGFVSHEAVLHKLLERAKEEHAAMAAEIERLRASMETHMAVVAEDAARIDSLRATVDGLRIQLGQRKRSADGASQ